MHIAIHGYKRPSMKPVPKIYGLNTAIAFCMVDVSGSPVGDKAQAV